MCVTILCRLNWGFKKVPLDRFCETSWTCHSQMFLLGQLSISGLNWLSRAFDAQPADAVYEKHGAYCYSGQMSPWTLLRKSCQQFAACTQILKSETWAGVMKGEVFVRIRFHCVRLLHQVRLFSLSVSNLPWGNSKSWPHSLFDILLKHCVVLTSE